MLFVFLVLLLLWFMVLQSTVVVHFPAIQHRKWDETTGELECILWDSTTHQWRHNRIIIPPILRNRKIIHSRDGYLQFEFTPEENDTVIDHLFPLYSGINVLEKVPIHHCSMITVRSEKYQRSFQETMQHLQESAILPPIEVYYGYLTHDVESQKKSPFFQYVDPSSRRELTLGMLEIFDQFATTSLNNENRWLLYFEDDVRCVHHGLDYRWLYNVPADAELIRPYIGSFQETGSLHSVRYRHAFGGGLPHALYISSSACRKVVHYTKKYGWKYNCDIDFFQLAKGCLECPTQYDGWSYRGCDGSNKTTPRIREEEKIVMYHMDSIFFDQTSLPVK